MQGRARGLGAAYHPRQNQLRLSSHGVGRVQVSVVDLSLSATFSTTASSSAASLPAGPGK